MLSQELIDKDLSVINFQLSGSFGLEPSRSPLGSYQLFDNVRKRLRMDGLPGYWNVGKN